MQSSTHFPGNQQVHENRYDVYVNQDFIGEKKIHDRKEDIFDLEEFLKEQGIVASTTELDGNHFYITELDQAIEKQVKEALHLYLTSG